MTNVQLAITLCAFLSLRPTPARDGLEVLSLSEVTREAEKLKPFVVARPGGGAYLAWAQRRDGSTAVYIARSTDDDRFDPPVKVSRDGHMGCRKWELGFGNPAPARFIALLRGSGLQISINFALESSTFGLNAAVGGEKT